MIGQSLIALAAGSGPVTLAAWVKCPAATMFGTALLLGTADAVGQAVTSATREGTLRVKVCSAERAAELAASVKGKVPDWVGVPLSTPVVASSVRPAGSEPTVIS